MSGGQFSSLWRSLSARVLFALVAGLALGAVLQYRVHPDAAVTAAVEAIGGLWLSALQMTVVPLVFSALVVGIAQASDAAATGRLAARAVALFVGLVSLVAVATLAAVPAILALVPVDASSAAALIAGVTPGSGAVLAPAADSGTAGGFAAWVTSLSPGNPVRAAADNAILPLVLFGVFFGFAATRLPAAQRAILGGFFEAVAAAMIVIVRWVLWAAPVGVFALAMALGLKGGLASAGALLHYVVLVSGACLATMLIAYPLATTVGRTSPGLFARAIAPVQAVAFSTQSSLGSLPVMLERSRDVLRIPEGVYGVVLPLAVAIFRITSPAANLSVALFIAHVYGLEPSLAQMAAAGLVALAISIGTVGLPGQVSFFASMAPICLALGVPMDLLPLLLAVEVIPDIFRTLGNVSADMAVTTVLARSEPASEAAAAPLSS